MSLFMSSVPFDTLKFVKRLKEAGVTEQQAEAQAEAFAEAVDMNLTTKQDLKDLKNELILKLGSICVVAVGMSVAIAKLLS